jgi:hypothetical protein
MLYPGASRRAEEYRHDKASVRKSHGRRSGRRNDLARGVYDTLQSPGNSTSLSVEKPSGPIYLVE